MNQEQSAGAIKETLLALARAQDARDASGYRACFADQVLIDQPNIPGWKPSVISADDWTAMAMQHLKTFHRTRHTVSDFQIQMEGDDAVCSARSRALHIMIENGVENSWEAIGTFSLRFKRIGAKWLIVARALKVEQELGDLQMKYRAAEKAAAAPDDAGGRPS